MDREFTSNPRTSPPPASERGTQIALIYALVAERLTTGQTQATTRFLFQIEFTGFSRIGIDPLSALRNNIPHYEVLQREPVIPQNDFRIYE